MQRLIYVNSLGKELDLYKGADFILEKVEGTGSSGRTIKSIKYLNGSGELVTGARMQERELMAFISLVGDTRRDMYRVRNLLCNALSLDTVFDKKGKLCSKLIYKNDYGMWWTPALLADDIQFRQRLKHYTKEIRLKFRCPSSYWYDLVEDIARIEFGGGAFKLPFKFPISFGRRNFETLAFNKGATNTPVEIRIQGQGEKPNLLNLSTGLRIKLINPVPVGHTLIINTDSSKLSVRIQTPEGNSINAFGLIDPLYPISEFELRPGENIIRYEHGAEAALSKIEFRWYARYEGV